MGDPATIAPLEDEEVTARKRGFMDMEDDVQPVTEARKIQKKDQHAQANRRDESILHKRLFEEELQKSKAFPPQIRRGLERLLDHPQICEGDPHSHYLPRLRLFYLTIGSSQPLLGFKAILHTARNLSDAHPNSVTTALPPRERYAEICRLASQEALCVLLRRYHIIELFKTAQASVFQEHGLIVQTPSIQITGGQAMAGNPVHRAQANLTEEVVGKIWRGPPNGTPEYQKIRRHVTELRRLANILAIWTDRYGFGVLALLPSGLNESGLNFNDHT